MNQNTFANLLQSTPIVENLVTKMGFAQATPIQEAVIPSILTGRHLYAGAKTGSGKTVAFLAPIGQMLLEGKIKKALILSPTRELALQIDDEAMRVFDEIKDVVSIPLYGGVPLDQQLRAMKIHHPRLYVATPGRFLDFISEGLLPLSDIDCCVLDEADRMCDMGFSPQIIEILSTLPSLKQVLMFSATLPKEATMIMERFLVDPVNVQVDNPEHSSSSIEHQAYVLDRRHKVSFLVKLLQGEATSTVVFTRTRKGADRLYDSLRQKNIRVGILHAGYSMGEREKTLRAYREGKLQTLVATDVAARGIDVDHITHVIHYDLPESVEDYIHRSGRAGRAGRKGTTIALIDRDNSSQKRQLDLIATNIKIEIKQAPGARESSDQTSERGERPRQNSDRSHQGQRRKRGPRNRQESPSARKDSPKTDNRPSKKSRSRRPTSGSDTRAPKAAASKSKPSKLMGFVKSIFKKKS